MKFISLLFTLLSLCILLIPLIFLIKYGYRRTKTGEGTSLLKITTNAFLTGLITPFASIIIFLVPTSFSGTGTEDFKCYTFISGFIVIGILINIIFLPLIAGIFKIRESLNEKSLLSNDNRLSI